MDSVLQTGFSGDVHVSWASLDFQVYFTVTASNVGFGYWSHDLGGHVGASPPELFTRWIQFGAFSPIFRIHPKKDSFMWRRPWLYPHLNYDILMNFFFLRAALVPYIYTNAREAYETGVSLMRPMYYVSPDNPLTYSYDHQYMFGNDILAAPVTTPLNPVYNTSQKSVFIPPTGVFVHWQSGEVFQGPQELTRNYTLAEMPLFARTGAIIPTVPRSEMSLGSAKELPQTLRLISFVAGGANMPGNGQVYEDDGATNSYKGEAYAVTNFKCSIDKSTPTKLEFTIGTPNGSFPGMLANRRYEIVLRGVWPAKTVNVDGVALQVVQHDTGCKNTAGCVSYDGTKLSMEIVIAPLPTNTAHTVFIELTMPLPSPMLQTNFCGQVARLAEAKSLLDNQWGIHTVHQQQYYSLLLAGETGMRITYTPDSVHDELTAFPALVKQARAEVEALSLSESGDLKSIVLELLS